MPRIPRGSPDGGDANIDSKVYRSRYIGILLLVSIVFHSILFSSRSIDDFQSRENAFNEATGYASQLLQSSNSQQQQQKKREQLPHWRIGTDCSSYSFDCFAVAQIQNKYRPYPFSLSARKMMEAPRDSENKTTKHGDEWSMETIEELPREWIQYLKKEDTNKSVSIKDRNYLYPPMVSEEEYESCIDLVVNQNKSTMEQLNVLFSGRIVPEPDTNMVAFTISDYSYVQDMLHDMFQMMHDVVGFSNKHFFLVAIDHRSAELACKYGYSVVLWKDDENNLRDAVANTKMILSYELVKRGIDFFFTEMDVWWIRSPKPNLVDFQKRHENSEDGHRGKHVYFSGHQNNHGAPNIGVYAVKADKYSEEYFRVCLDVLKEKPETHDQHAMAEVHRLFQSSYESRPYEFGGRFLPDGPPKVPTIKHAFQALYFSPHEVVADERPTTTRLTLAIHTLNGEPLQAPHGKKMNAKELGVYYGFHSHPQGTFDARTDDAGYYDRSGRSRRYLWLDTELRNNFYSIANPDHYHDKKTLEWTMAILIAIARKTNRILVLPQVFDADMDAGTYCAWTMMDYSKVMEMVDFREAHFLSNPKAWRNGGVGPNQWPFESVVNTALFRGVGNENIATIYTQVSDRSSIVSTEIWKAIVEDREWLDAWVGSLSVVPELDSAEVLLVNPDAFMDGGIAGSLAFRLNQRQKKIQQLGEDHEDIPRVGQMEQEVFEIYNLLGWCWDIAFRHTANKVSASDSCFGIGKSMNH